MSCIHGQRCRRDLNIFSIEIINFSCLTCEECHCQGIRCLARVTELNNALMGYVTPYPNALNAYSILWKYGGNVPSYGIPKEEAVAANLTRCVHSGVFIILSTYMLSITLSGF
ncbi:uncharacterized protein PHALS_13614 [Plasmopara halstedii]|uniref:Uncharacterized protein n=1 Tax=Plasmopara halstedii TaxID=4781 RepID=A0A0P1APM0_PLAHL|nr:uncharacterized protein PHALS_13614 [Plasmopara halstedii]CEG43417.1 hypothetical protein PHALS_13614 [Plasmopara halstedii]|eukprot:XP_024579786.1 hypothetical protein PHALS_13614 [Plasmopara halstedii]